MTRKECEKKLLDLMDEAYRIFKEFDPEGGHLSLFATDVGCCAIGNKEIEGKLTMILNGFKSENGCYRFSE